MKGLLKAGKRLKIEAILHKFRDLKFIAGIKTNNKRAFIGAVLDTNGELQSNRQCITDVFADFCATLYSKRDSDSMSPGIVFEEVPAVTVRELRQVLRRMKNRKSCDTQGVVTELLKYSSDSLLEVVAQVFTDVLHPQAEVPSSWKQSRFKVLFKEGDPHNVENYRPIAILPILYKRISMLLCSRTGATLNEPSLGTKLDFVRGFRATTIYFRKAFDTVGHVSLWEALREQGVPSLYIHFLHRLYSDQSGHIQTDVLSKGFPIQRCARQGNPISPTIFNAVLEQLMRGLCTKWENSSLGIDVAAPRKLTNLRFADDLVLLASSLKDARRMLKDLAGASSRLGLEVHSSKTKFMWNGFGSEAPPDHTAVGQSSYDVLRGTAAATYLGVQFSFEDS